MNQLIFITGYAGSGKDTIGNYLVKNYDFKKYAFADILKKRFCLLYNIPLYLLYTQKGKKKIMNINGVNLSLREHLIIYAQHQRSLNPNIWVDLILKQINFNKHKKICITDWRQENELEILKFNLKSSYNISTIRVINDNIKPQFTDNFLDDFNTDYTFFNNSSLDNLFQQIDKNIAFE